MKIGLILPLGETTPGVPHDYDGIRSLARQAEDAGLDTLWVYDHLLADGTADAEESPWEAWSMLCAIAEATSRVRLGTLVLCTSFRNAGVLARMADTLQEISDNRLLLGIGSGWHEPEYDAFGMPFAGRVDGFEEAVQILTGMLREGRATVEGAHHRAVDAPVRLRPGRVAPEILIASVKPRMLRLTARYADSWNLAWFGFPSDRFTTVNRALDAACEQEGRDPASLRRTVGLLVHAEEPEEPEPGDQAGGKAVLGSPEEVREALEAWQEQGVDEVVLNLMLPTPAELQRAAAGVALFRAGRDNG